MKIRCECGAFSAELKGFPKNTPGRLVCYCDDCQTYLHYLKRGDLLDENGGTEVIPAYPVDVQILKGQERLKCVRLSPNGMFRFSTSCCNTPIANTRAGTPWVGFLRRVYTVEDPNSLDRALGPVRSRINGRFAKGKPPAGTPKNMSLTAILSVLPFILKGKILKLYEPSPFFKNGGAGPIVPPHILSKAERQDARVLAGVSS